MLKKVFLFIASALLIWALWTIGLEKLYAHILTFSTNIVVGLGGNHTSIILEEVDRELVFKVSTLVDGRRGSYPQKAQTLLLPFVMVLAWQFVLFFSLPWRNALKTTGVNLLIFLSFHVLFMLMLTSYYNSQGAKFFFHLMMESFYIVALVLIIKDSIKYPGIWKTR